MLIRLLREPFHLFLALALALGAAALGGVLFLFAGYDLLVLWLPRWAALGVLAIGLLSVAGLAAMYFERLERERVRRREAFYHSKVDLAARVVNGLFSLTRGSRKSN